MLVIGPPLQCVNPSYKNSRRLSKLSPANRTSGVSDHVDLQPLCWRLAVVLITGGLMSYVSSLRDNSREFIR